MGWLWAVAFLAAIIPAYRFSKKWPRGILVPVGAIVGIVSNGVLTSIVAFAMNSYLPSAFPLVGGGNENGVFDVYLATIALSLIVSPISAIYGWRRGRQPEQLGNARPVDPPGAFDNIKGNRGDE